MLYMPPGNAEAMVHYDDTIQRRAKKSGGLACISA